MVRKRANMALDSQCPSSTALFVTNTGRTFTRLGQEWPQWHVDLRPAIRAVKSGVRKGFDFCLHLSQQMQSLPFVYVHEDVLLPAKPRGDVFHSIESLEWVMHRSALAGSCGIICRCRSDAV